MVTSSEAELYELLNRKDHQVTAVRTLMGGEFVRIDTKPLREKAQKTGNIVLALLTTSYARIKLYHVIREFEKEIVYFVSV